MKDYVKLCPKLSDYIAKEIIDADTAEVKKKEESQPILTKEKVEIAYEMLKVDPQYLKIASAVGLDISQVKELHKEFLTYKNYSEDAMKVK